MNSTVQYGIIGYGPIGKRYAWEFQYMPELLGRTHLRAILDPTFTHISPPSSPSLRYCTNLDDFINTPGLQAVIICTPPQFHANYTIACLEAGFHVFCEVPMALTLTEIEKIMAAQAHSGKIYQYGENYCYYSEVLYARWLNSQKKFGSIARLRSEFIIDESGRKRDWYATLDPLMYGHSIGPALWILSLPGSNGVQCPKISEVISYGSSQLNRADTTCFGDRFTFHQAFILMESGAIIDCTNAFVSPRARGSFHFEVIGNQGFYSPMKIGHTGQWVEVINSSINPQKFRKVSHRIGQWTIGHVIPRVIGNYYGANTRIKQCWLDAIQKQRAPDLDLKLVAQICAVGIYASQSAREGGKKRILTF